MIPNDAGPPSGAAQSGKNVIRIETNACDLQHRLSSFVPPGGTHSLHRNSENQAGLTNIIRPRLSAHHHFSFSALRLEDHALACLAVHHGDEWRWELQMPHAAVLLDGGLVGEPLPIHEAFAGVGVDGEVADLECGEVLEEVAALRRDHAKVAEA